MFYNISYLIPRSIKKATACEYMLYFTILMVSGTTQLVASLTTAMHGDNVMALYRHSYLAGTATTYQAIKLGQTSNKGAWMDIDQITPPFAWVD